MKSAHLHRPIACAALMLALSGIPARPADHTLYRQTNLVSDLNRLARRTDPNLVNAWGITSSPTGPWWW